MDLLPVELVRLVFQYCEPSSVRALRLASGRYADVGYDFLIDSHFTAVEWRDDIKRLRAIAGHDRLRGSIRSLTFNLSKPDDCNNGRHTPPFHTRTQTLEDIFQRLPNLHTLEVTVPNNHHNITTPHHPCRKRPDRALACKNMTALVTALRHTPPTLTSLTLNPVPLELFRTPSDRRHWLDCCARLFSTLTSLTLVLDPPPSLLPSARFRAVSGLGHLLACATPELKFLSLAFRSAHAPRRSLGCRFGDYFPGGRRRWCTRS